MYILCIFFASALFKHTICLCSLHLVKVKQVHSYREAKKQKRKIESIKKKEKNEKLDFLARNDTLTTV